MGIRDSIGKGVDKVKNKTNDAIDINSLKSKINEEKRNIESKKMDIGEFYWSSYKDGKKIDPDAKGMVESIEKSLKKIEEYEKEIAEIKKD